MISRLSQELLLQSARKAMLPEVALVTFLSPRTRCLTEAAKGRKGFTGSQLQAGSTAEVMAEGLYLGTRPIVGLLPPQWSRKQRVVAGTRL